MSAKISELCLWIFGRRPNGPLKQLRNGLLSILMSWLNKNWWVERVLIFMATAKDKGLMEIFGFRLRQTCRTLAARIPWEPELCMGQNSNLCMRFLVPVWPEEVRPRLGPSTDKQHGPWKVNVRPSGQWLHPLYHYSPSIPLRSVPYSPCPLKDQRIFFCRQGGGTFLPSYEP